MRHFLIECTQKGVRLKGCPNEPYFGETQQTFLGLTSKRIQQRGGLKKSKNRITAFLRYQATKKKKKKIRFMVNVPTLYHLSSVEVLKQQLDQLKKRQIIICSICCPLLVRLRSVCFLFKCYFFYVSARKSHSSGLSTLHHSSGSALQAHPA